MKNILAASLVFLAILATTAKGSENFLNTVWDDVNPSPRIVRGQRASEGQFPYQVLITAYGSILGIAQQFTCGGVIITTEWILTAAHCTKANANSLLSLLLDMVRYEVEAGSVTLGQGQNRQSRTVPGANAISHPQYSSSTLLYDIAVMKASTPFVFNTFVSSIQLVPSSTNVDDYVGQTMTVSGFGNIATGGPSSTNLLWAELTIISRATCQLDYGTFTLPFTCFCGKSSATPASAICQGDSGGPATIGQNDQRRLVGVVSFTSNSGCDVAAQGFTSVAFLRNWIDQTIGINLK